MSRLDVSIPFGIIEEDRIDLFEFFTESTDIGNGKKFYRPWFRPNGESLFLQELELVPIRQETRTSGGWSVLGSGTFRDLHDMLEHPTPGSELATFATHNEYVGKFVIEAVNVLYFGKPTNN
ncbi:MAG: hypothetical protein JWO47_83 [Candidatus Saccharibacteria bacterium]|nr:hypothetical protein [Candidatus Saccharibacteria bacterium]